MWTGDEAVYVLAFGHMHDYYLPQANNNDFFVLMITDPAALLGSIKPCRNGIKNGLIL
jgi:hypothetical protein